MIVDDSMLGLCSVHEAVCAHFVDQTGSATREPINLIDGLVREDVMVLSRVGQVPADVLGHFGPIVVREFALDVDALPDCSIRLEIESIPEFTLSNQDE